MHVCDGVCVCVCMCVCTNCISEVLHISAVLQYVGTYVCLYPPSNCYTPVQELERQHGAVLALGFVGKHALLQSIDRTLHMVAESQADPVELASKRPRAGDITLDVVTKLGEWQAVVLWS